MKSLISSDRLRELINILDITLADFAQRVVSDPSTVSKYISGKRNPSKSTVNSILLTYNVNPEWLNGDCEGPVFLHELELEKRKLINQIQDMDLEEIELMKKMCIRDSIQAATNAAAQLFCLRKPMPYIMIFSAILAISSALLIMPSSSHFSKSPIQPDETNA